MIRVGPREGADGGEDGEEECGGDHIVVKGVAGNELSTLCKTTRTH